MFYPKERLSVCKTARYKATTAVLNLLQVLWERTPVQFLDCSTENGGSKLL
jgi:hypothetical protein